MMALADCLASSPSQSEIPFCTVVLEVSKNLASCRCDILYRLLSSNHNASLYGLALSVVARFRRRLGCTPANSAMLSTTASSSSSVSNGRELGSSEPVSCREYLARIDAKPLSIMIHPL